MKRLILLVSVLLLLISSSNIAYGQDFDYERANQDYTHSYNLYRESYPKYVSARGEYLNYKTLNAETKAIEATKDMLQKRDDVLRTYLTALRMKLVSTTGVVDYGQNVAFLKLDSEVNWLLTHKTSASQAGSLNDLLKVSSELENKNKDVQLLSYQTLGLILSSKQNSSREKLVNLANVLSSKIEQMKKEGESTEKIERWLQEAKKKISLSEEKQKEAEKPLMSMKNSEYDMKNIFSGAQLKYEESNKHLIEATAFLFEIIDEIKYE